MGDCILKIFNIFCTLLIVYLAYLNFVNEPYLFTHSTAQSSQQHVIKDYFKRPSQPVPSDLIEDEKNSIQVYDNAAPSVVFITKNTTRRHLFSNVSSERAEGSGTGFVWDDAGHIVTNYHVIQGASSLVVRLGDYSQYSATIVGEAPHKDIAVLKINAPSEKIHPLSVGQSSDLRVGQKVLAIGNPFGLDQTLTTGVISAKGREITAVTGRKIQNVIQTDAAINPGNSGGPLLNSRGQLIGVNTSIVSKSGSSSGIGFAVPIDTVKKVVPQLIEHGKVIQPGLGITVIDDARARQSGYSGVIIDTVQRGSSAHRAGLKGVQYSPESSFPIDIIVGINQQKIRSFEDLARALENHKVGDEVTVYFLRGKEKKSVKLKLQQLN